MIKVESTCPHYGATFEIGATFLGLYHVKCFHCDRVFPTKVQIAETIVGIKSTKGGIEVWQYARKVKL